MHYIATKLQAKTQGHQKLQTKDYDKNNNQKKRLKALQKIHAAKVEKNVCELMTHYTMPQMKVLTLEVNENNATNKNHNSMMLQHVENIVMYKNHKTIILQVKALQVDENIAMKRNIKAQCYK
jgi:hypothetical protein